MRVGGAGGAHSGQQAAARTLLVRPLVAPFICLIIVMLTASDAGSVCRGTLSYDLACTTHDHFSVLFVYATETCLL